MTISHAAYPVIIANSIKTTAQWTTGANFEVTFDRAVSGRVYAYFSQPLIVTWGPNHSDSDGSQLLAVHHWGVQVQDFQVRGNNQYVLGFGIQFNGSMPVVQLIVVPQNAISLPTPTPTPVPTPAPTPSPAPSPTPTPSASAKLVKANLLKPSNYTQASLNQQMQSYYQTWKQQYLRTYQNGAYLLYQNSGPVTVSEAQGYLMLASVMMNDQTVFDQAVNFYLKFKDPKGLMSWRISNNNGALYVASSDNTSATDGDLDIAFALYLAHYQWGSTATVNYLSLAQAVSEALINSCVNKNLFSLKLGDWVTDDTSSFGLVTRSSDFMLGHIKLFSLVDTMNATTWQKVYNSLVSLCVNFVPKYANNTGFMSDFVVYQNGAWVQPTGQVLESANDPDYNWNACRLFMRLASDALDEKPNQGITNIIQKSNSFIKSACGQNPANIYAGYHLNGSPLANYHNLAFQAPFMLSAAISHDQTWLNTLYDYVLNQKSEGYYPDSIKLISMLMITGNYLTVAL